jgi:hypothetical protein
LLASIRAGLAGLSYAGCLFFAWRLQRSGVGALLEGIRAGLAGLSYAPPPHSRIDLFCQDS